MATTGGLTKAKIAVPTRSFDGFSRYLDYFAGLAVGGAATLASCTGNASALLLCERSQYRHSVIITGSRSP
jgi:hypothetical protein